MKTPQGGKRFVALSAAVALGLGGAMIAGPATATTAAPTADAESAAPATVTDDATEEAPAEAPKDLAEAVSAVAASDENILDKVAAIGYNADGEVTVQTVAGADVKADSEILEPVAALAEAEGQDELHVTPIANGYSPANATDVVGGAGYAVAPNGGAAEDITGLCSFGFPAEGPNGEEAILTAGHCAEEGASVFLEKPSTSNAGTGDYHGGAQFPELLKDTAIGTFTASEFGKTIVDVDDPDAGNPDNYTPEDTQDFAVITLDDETLETHPEVTDWTTAGEDDLSASTTSVAGVHDVTGEDVGKPMWRSGRTSGMEEGTVGSEDGGGYIGDIVDGYGLVGMPDSPDPNNPEIGLVYGFAAEALGIPGDSGGAVMMGDQAVGVTSLSNYDPATQEGDWIWVAELAKGLETVADGYTVKTTESTEEPTETAEPTPTETEDADVDPALAVDPQEITAEQFIAEDEDQAIEDDRGVTYTVTDVEPGSEVTFDTYVEDQAANAGSGAAAPAADGDDEPAKTITVTADENGTASSRVWGLPTADASAYVGDYSVVATTEDETLEGSFQVVDGDNGDGGQDDGDNGDDLPRTGSTTGPLVAGAAGLVALGGALVYVARRRQA